MGINNAGQIVGEFYTASPFTGSWRRRAARCRAIRVFTTFDGRSYAYQGRGDFVLGRSTVAGDQFDVQIRTETWAEFPWRSIVSEAAATLCGHTASIDVDRAAAGDNLVWIDGRPSSLSLANPTLNLDGCMITERSANSWEAVWDTGEILDITNNSRNYLNLSSWYSPFLGPGSVEGLLSSSDNPEAWRIDAAASLFATAVPEPATLTLLGISLIGFGVIRRRRTAPNAR